MTDDARKRIQALEQFSELEGFNIAMKDLRFVVPEIYWRRAKWFHQ
jgi:hypothetical protein